MLGADVGLLIKSILILCVAILLAQISDFFLIPMSFIFLFIVMAWACDRKRNDYSEQEKKQDV